MPGNACRAGLRVASEPLFRPLVLQTRWFSASAPRHGKVLSFPETSSPELDSVLSTIRMKILLPAYLPADLRKKLHRPRYTKKLANNPVTMEVDGEEIKFFPLDPTKRGNLPNTRRILFEAIDKMETREDWAQLSPLLEGMHYYANKTLQHDDYPKMTRRAGAKGQIRAILDCAQRPDRTGFRLDSTEKVHAVMHWIVAAAVASGWDSRVLEKSLRWAEGVVDLAELQDQARRDKPGKPGAPKPRFPLHRDPVTLSMPLYLAAALAVKQLGLQDMEKKVARYAKDFVALWPEDTTLRQLHPLVSNKDETHVRHLHVTTGYLLAASPILNALGLAMKVVDPDLAKQLAVTVRVLEAEFSGVIADQPDGVGTRFHQQLSEFKEEPQQTGQESLASP